mmetsp:Transcript_32449/g.41536  ORF Transcript_32449/g.41536 Transcript_32449/m.41536 type:complete len:673 (+) Transcript_32449:68-2086(+)
MRIDGTFRLSTERTSSNVRPHNFAFLIYGGKSRYERMKTIVEMVESDPIFSRKDRRFMNHTQKYVRSCQKSLKLSEKISELKTTDRDDIKWLYFALNEVTPVDVHQSMFIPCLDQQTSPAQRERWLGPAKRFEILGAYAQTELGHGSNVRALETTANYDPEMQEFIVNSPTLTSTKWWPGGLGKTATHCVLYARLITGGKDYGVHGFFMPLRSLKDHSPLPGRVLGDIGPKVGFNSNDNGFARFHQVRIPRDYMLMGFAEVTPSGEYRKKTGGEKLAYGAMLDVRANLVIMSSLSLAKALTIAIRYSAVRCQGFIGDGTFGQPERPVLDYPTQQRALLPLLATAYAFNFMGQSFQAAYDQYLKDFDMSRLPALHAASSGLKAIITKDVSDGIETCRKMCGGHGYSQFGGFSELGSDYLALCTLEGTQQVLEPQTARYLLRALSRGRKEGIILDEDVYYLQDPAVQNFQHCQATSANELLDPSLQIHLYQLRSKRMALQAEVCIGKLLKEGMPQAEALAMGGVELGHATRAHCQLLLVKEFWNGIRQLQENNVHQLNASEFKTLTALANLFALSVMEKEMAEFRNGDILSSNQGHLVHEALSKLCSEVRRDAVVLVDSWSFSDAHLESALGRSNGDVYNALFEMVKQEPLNHVEVTEGYNKYLKHMINPSAKL